MSFNIVNVFTTDEMELMEVVGEKKKNAKEKKQTVDSFNIIRFLKLRLFKKEFIEET